MFHLRRISRRYSKRCLSTIQVHLVPLFTDNYSYLIVDTSTGIGACVDPGHAEPIINKISQFQKQNTFQLRYILATHKHADHVDGILELKDKYSNVEVIGTGYETIPGVTKNVFDNETFQIGNLNVRTIYTPCHTAGHVCFHVQDANNVSSILFSGDTLFLGGCGRFFEGTPKQMLENMDKFLQLSPSTKIFCGHEYTLSNLYFLRHLYHNQHPDLLEITQQYINKYENLRNQNLPTIPSTIEDERRYNAFMKCREQSIQDIVQLSNNPIDTMMKIRELKTNYKG